MKKITLLLILILGFIPVKAANYELKELIPVNIETTIVTNNFSYKGLYYNKNNASLAEKDYIIFKGIKNLTGEEKPISISIAFFNKERKNIGIMNYCSTKISNDLVAKKMLQSKEEISYSIEITKDYLGSEYTKDEIQYIAVLNDNKNCRVASPDEYIGKTIEKIGTISNQKLDESTRLMLNVFTVVGIIFVVVFIYKFLFTKSFQNFDGEDIRKGFEDLNNNLSKAREEERKNNPIKEKEKKSVKTEKVLKQEEEAKNEDKSGTELHNLYK